jgi:hypothetical protein
MNSARSDERLEKAASALLMSWLSSTVLALWADAIEQNSMKIALK